MKATSLAILTDFSAATIDPRLYGSFVEHLGRCVYTGIYEPDHPEADAQGFRQDVAALARELGPTVLRYPGGNFVSAYRWEDGVGPLTQRPARLDMAWRTTETNHVGPNEFLPWCRALGAEPMMAVNLGTRGVPEALDLVEFCNHPGGSALSDLRRSHGFRDPHNVRLWCLGNEMDGPWQTGHKTAHEYGRLACETGRALRQFDPTLELVACGSSGCSMDSYPEWDRTVLEHCYDQVDYLSMHIYLNDQEPGGARPATTAAYLAEPLRMDRFIREIIGVCDYARARHRGKKDIHISFDEWNVWDHYHCMHPGNFTPWMQAPAQVEQTFTVRDAVVFGAMLLALMRQAARVRIACLAQLVNVIAPIMTAPGGPAWRQTIFHPFSQCARHGRGELVPLQIKSAGYATESFSHVPYVEAVATRDGDGLTIFAINRHETESASLDAALVGGRWDLIEHQALHDADPYAANTQTTPGRVTPHPVTGGRVSGENLAAALPPLSWNMLRLRSL